ncbi:MAG: helix-turn-helix domain-containing protein, partial [Eubacterium sp.]
MRYEIGIRIRKYRELRGLSQKELADLIGVSNSRVSNWEQGINRPNADIISDLCKALDVSPSELLDIQIST